MLKTNKYPSIKCTECDSIFHGQLEVYEHSKIHDKNHKEREDGYNLHCDDCNVDLQSFDNFYLHMKDHHDITNKRDIKPVKCRWCGERCRNLLGLCTHIRIIHRFDGAATEAISSDIISKATKGKGSTFLCMICGKELQSQSSYTHHMTVHAGIKLYNCDICEAKFM